LNELLGFSVGERIVADYVVLGVALLTWAGIFFYLVRLDRRVRKLGER
jgi:CcmD family protein